MSQSHQTPKKKSTSFLASVSFSAGVSVLVSMISLALPWWGVDTAPVGTSPAWGPFWGPPNATSLTRVAFFSDRLQQSFSANYVLVAALIVLTWAFLVAGARLKRWPVLAAAFLSSIVTDLAFVASVAQAVNTECNGMGVFGASCITGLTGQGASPFSFAIVTWGFKTGFYLYLASGVLILVTIAVQRYKASQL